MAGDFEIERGLTLGDWLHAEITEHFSPETDGWAVERARRVGERQ